MIINWGYRASHAKTIHYYNQRGYFDVRILAFSGVVYTSYGLPFLYSVSNWAQISFYLEAYLRATTGTVYFRLYNETDGSEVLDSELSTTSATFERLRTIALTLADGKMYRIQFGKAGSDAGETYGGQLIGIDNV